MLASHRQDPFFLDFVEDGLVSDVEFTPEGAPLVNLRRIGLRDGGAADAPTQEDGGGAEPEAASEESASAAEESATGWRVDLDVDHPRDTMGNAWSPSAPAPEALAGAEDDYSASIRYLCLNAGERELGNVAPVMIVFRTAPRLAMVEGGQPGEYGQIPLELRANWGGEEVAFKASYSRIVSFDQEDAAERETGESSHEEFVRRLLESGSMADDAVEIEVDWEEMGPVSYTFSLEGAADAIREAGRPCGVG